MALTSLESLNTRPLDAKVQLRAVGLTASNLVLGASDSYFAENGAGSDPTSTVESSTPQRFYAVYILAEKHTNKDVIVEIAKATPKSARVWIGPWPRDQHAFADFTEVGTRASLNGMAVRLRTDAVGKAALLLESGKYLVASPKVMLWDADAFAVTATKQERKRAMYLTLFLSLAWCGAAVALVSRDTSFLMFSAGLVTALRVLARNSGWG